MAAKKRGKRVESSIGVDPWKPTKKGEILEGTYLGAKLMPPDVGGKGQAFFSFHFRKPPDKEHPDGERVCVASAMLNSKMNQVPKGTYCWLTYLGKVTVGKGESNSFDLELEEGAEILDEDDCPPLDAREAWATYMAGLASARGE
jgi:hypothetical protein